MYLNAPISDHGLTNTELSMLRKGNFQTVTDLVLATTQDIAKRCRTSPIEVKRLVDKVLDAIPLPPLTRLDSLETEVDELFTTGDESLDTALGGGIRTKMVWEVVGESAAGKTQLALQLSLFVQTPTELGGLSGATCYLTTSSKLPTGRLLQIYEANELSLSGCGLEHVHTIPAPTVAVLQRVLTEILPTFIEKQAAIEEGRKVKLLVIDALGELFHSNAKTTMATLVERSKDIVRISASLHELASKYRLAVLVLNEVMDVFDRPARANDGGDLLYDSQSRHFNTAVLFGDGKKEASLGLVWANQVNSRIMLTRTGRRRYLNEGDLPKRQRLPETEGSARLLTGAEQSDPTLIRRLSVIFSSVSRPIALDYVVTECGISVLRDQNASLPSNISIMLNKQEQTGLDTTTLDDLSQVDVPSGLEKKAVAAGGISTVLAEGDEFDMMWTQGDSYENFDWDALEEGLSQTIH